MINSRKVFFRILLLGVLFSGFLTGCGPGVRIYTDVDEEARFNEYQTYSFLEFSEGNQKTITGMELERIRTAIAREIETKGLRFVEKEGDVSVQITVYHRQGIDAYYHSPRRYNYMERALAVDMYDNLIRKHVWHGAAVGELVYNPSSRAEELPLVVAKIFERYPLGASTQN
jgi:hypothetical protein